MVRFRGINKTWLIRTSAGLALSALGGLAFVLAFPPYELWPLAFFGFVPVLVAQHRVMPSKISSLATAVGIAVWLQGYLGPVFAPIGTYMIWLPVIAFLLSFLIDRDQKTFHVHTGYRWFLLSGITSWAAIEMIRLFLPVAGTWAFIAYPLYRQLWLIQPASIFGIIGTGALVMMVNHILALLAIYLLDHKMLSLQALHDSQIPVSKVMVRRSAQVGAVIFGGWLLISLILYSGRPNQELVRVAAIQPALSPIVLSNRGEDITSLYQQMIRQSRKAAGQGARLIVWPEGALSWDPQVEDKLELANLARDTNSYLATGYVVVVGTEGFRNEATVINPQGQFLGIFGKDHPVVFGGETSLSRGSYPVYNTDIGTLATIICYDLDYTDTTRRMVEQGAQIIATPSNDWGSIADKHYTHVVFRAIENRVAMVKADGGYNSAIIDPYGHIIELAVFPEGGEATLVADLLPGDGRGTINTRFGDWVGWIAIGGLLFFTFGSRWLIKNNNTDVPNNNPREQG